MPRLSRPLASLSARGIIGGRRQGYTARLRFYVQDYPAFNYGGAATTFAVNVNTSALVAKFFLPFHLNLAKLLTQWPTVTTGSRVQAAVYSESGGTRHWRGTSPGNPTANSLFPIPGDETITLLPGAYWLALVPTSSPVDMLIRSHAQSLNVTYSRPNSDGWPPYSGTYVLPVAGLLPDSIDPAAVVPASNSTPACRLRSA